MSIPSLHDNYLKLNYMMFYEGRKHTTTNFSFPFGTWVRSTRIFTYIWLLKQVRINSIKFGKASLPSTCIVFAKTSCWQREMALRTTVTCSTLSVDDWDDEKVKGTRVSSRLIFVFALSQFRRPDYLGAWNSLGLVVGGYLVLLVKHAM